MRTAVETTYPTKIDGLLGRQKLKHFSKKLLTLRLDPNKLKLLIPEILDS